MLAKQLADFITLLRSSLTLFFPWLALVYGRDSLPWAGALLVFNWSGDMLDGSLARRSSPYRHTWIGDHDLEVDMGVALGVLLYLAITGFVQATVVVLYVSVWAVYFIIKGVYRSMGMLCQAPVYAWFIYTALNSAPKVGWLLVGWILAAVIATWPRFPQEVIPNFLNGIRIAFHQD